MTAMEILRRPEEASLLRQVKIVAQSFSMMTSRLSNMNWRRGIAEVALIFIGISLALLFDNWNEARKDRILEKLFLHMLVPAETVQLLGSKPLLLSAPIEVKNWEELRADHELVHWLMELLERTQAALAFNHQALSQLDEIVVMINSEISH
jgi:hypothetical protein